MKYIVLGHTGFVGSAIFTRLISENMQVIGINSSLISDYTTTNPNVTLRLKKYLFDEFDQFISSDTVIINCIWGDLNLENRNSNSHNFNSELEISLLKNLRNRKISLYISFGSVLEIQELSDTLTTSSKYVRSKKTVLSYLEKSKIPYSWIRLANIFGPNDKKERIITKLILDRINFVDTELINPNQIINIYHIDKFINTFLSFLLKPLQGRFNALSDSWVTIAEVKQAVYKQVEPNYQTINSIFTNIAKKEIMYIESTSFVDFANSF